ncbi:MAG: M1 family metallopeptidase [bacterium]
MKKPHILILSIKLGIALFTINQAHSQTDRWQQRVNYKMDVIVDAQNNRFNGKQRLEYWNNSPDTLKVLYYHLYWNAFQPGSMMDVRSIELGKKIIRGRQDWDQRVKDRISKLKENEIGYQRIHNVKVNGISQKNSIHETIMKIELSKPILPRSRALIELDFEAQVPVQIRRSGRDNAEGVRFSMAQWYPKLCEYDQNGWHPNPYIAREFYGVWGDFEVNITIDSSYVIGATGYLQNPHEIGHGYETFSSLPYKRGNIKDLTWKFKAPNVHDFVWAADPDYIHNAKKVRNGLILHSFYKIDSNALSKEYEKLNPKLKASTSIDSYINNYKLQWDSVLELASRALPYIDKNFGTYPYKQYSFIQGGDGGMEYPMATLLKGAGTSVVIHEWMHSWYQMVLATNESLYPWMDEGFTSFAESRVINFLKNNIDSFPHADAFDAYIALSKSEFNEPLTTHSDQYNTNTAYTINSYSKGEVFMEQLGYIVGSSVRDTILKRYFDKWKFKHPTPNDLIRLAENISGIELDWYHDFFVNTTKTIDYGIDSLWNENGKINLRIRNHGNMPMPIDIEMSFKDGTIETAYIPQYLMFGIKENEEPSVKRTIGEPWRWTHPTYTIQIDRSLLDMKKIEIDPKKRTADVERKNNKLELNW